MPATLSALRQIDRENQRRARRSESARKGWERREQREAAANLRRLKAEVAPRLRAMGVLAVSRPSTTSWVSPLVPPKIRGQIRELLARRPASPTEIAAELDCSFGEAVRQVAVLVQLGEEGLGPRVHRVPGHRYLIDPDEAHACTRCERTPHRQTGRARPRSLHRNGTRRLRPLDRDTAE